MSVSNTWSDEEIPFADYVIAALRTPEEAERAVKDLEAGGFRDEDVRLSAPPEEQQGQHKLGTLADTPSPAKRVFTEEGLDQERYEAERQWGHVIVHVRTPHADDVERARAILVAHHAHSIKRVGRWTRENLPEA
jgi:hypothetical protein